MEYSVNGVVKSTTWTNKVVDISTVVDTVWSLAASKVTYISGAKTVTVPKRGAKNQTEDLDITNTWQDGYTKGESQAQTEYSPDYITQDTDNQQITVYNAAGDTLATYSVSDTWDAGYASGSGSVSQRSVSALAATSNDGVMWTIGVTYDDSSGGTASLNATSIYTAARSGYTQGKFTKVDHNWYYNDNGSNFTKYTGDLYSKQS